MIIKVVYFFFLSSSGSESASNELAFTLSDLVVEPENSFLICVENSPNNSRGFPITDASRMVGGCDVAAEFLCDWASSELGSAEGDWGWASEAARVLVASGDISGSLSEISSKI